MNRLSVYSYLTRYIHGHAGFGELFTEPLPEKRYQEVSRSIVKLYFQRMVTFLFEGGGGGGLQKVVTSFLFLATLNFLNGP